LARSSVYFSDVLRQRASGLSVLSLAVEALSQVCDDEALVCAETGRVSEALKLAAPRTSSTSFDVFFIGIPILNSWTALPDRRFAKSCEATVTRDEQLTIPTARDPNAT